MTHQRVRVLPAARIALSLLIIFAGVVAQAQVTPSADSYTNTAKSTTNYGAETTLAVDGATEIAYIQFNLASVPTTASISQATLKLYVNSVTTAGSFNVDYVNGSWEESTIDASNAPPLGSAIASNVSITTTDKNQYILVNVTSAVQAWLNGSEANNGLALVADGTFDATFDSKENTTTSHPAELDIAFAGGDGTITGVTTASGSGLSGGGTSGTLGLSLLSSCSANQTLQWSGSAWNCTSAGTGTITGVTAGTGITGGGTSGTVSVGINTSVVPELAANNTFTGTQTVNNNVTIKATGTTLTASGGTIGVSGTGSGSSSFGVWGTADTAGVYGFSSASLGVQGTSDSSDGVYGSSTSGDGVYGSSSSNAGVYGSSTSGTGVVGQGITGVQGTATAYGGYGGDFAGFTAPASSGESGTTGLQAKGGNGDPESPGTSGGDGVTGTGGTGDVFIGTGGDGVGGNFTGGDSTEYGDGIEANAGSGFAGYFNGDVDIIGSLAKSSGSFKIDDPLDPADKYLYHSFVESPDMKNIYDGVATLDASGEAVITMPEWFSVLNRDFRYQLTCIGGFAPVYIAEELANNQFKIGGGRAGMRVSWQITGIRQDPWANAHRIPVEIEKEARLKGFYIHPELYGAPPEKQIEWARHPQQMKEMQEMRMQQQARPAGTKPASAKGLVPAPAAVAARSPQ